MRQILVDSARQFHARKTAEDFLELNEGFEKLKAWDERKCQVLELVISRDCIAKRSRMHWA